MTNDHVTVIVVDNACQRYVILPVIFQPVVRAVSFLTEQDGSKSIKWLKDRLYNHLSKTVLSMVVLMDP